MKQITILTCILVISGALFLSAQPVNAATDSQRYTMTRGGTWTYKTLDLNYVNKNKINLRSAHLVQKVEFISPATVQIMANDLGKKVGFSLSKSGVKYGIELAGSYGITVAKKKLIEKFGYSTASKMIPYLATFSWSYIALDVLNDITTGQNLFRLTSAASKKTGLIYEKAMSGGWDASRWFYWDGSSRYGKYPTVYLNPNKYQIGRVSYK